MFNRKEYMKEYHKNHRKYHKKTDKEKENNKLWMRKNNYRWNKTDKTKESKKKYLKSDKGKKSIKKYMNKYYKSEENLIKTKARTIVNNKIRNGELIKQPCSVCGTTEKIQAHHEDYTKALEVIWLCSKHHTELHKRRDE